MAGDEPDKYKTFWGEFGRVMKEGIIDDPKNRETIAGLLRMASTAGEGDAQTVSFADYIARMKEGQGRIYYITADNFPTAAASPHLEVFRKHGVEVLLLTDEVDEWWVHHLTEFDGKPLQSVAKGALDLAELGKEAENAERKDEKDDDTEDATHADLVARVKEALGERVKDVRVSGRLTESPACLVADEQDMGGHLERLLRAAGQKVPSSRPVLELNTGHSMVRMLEREHEQARFADWAGILFDQALLCEGGRLEDPAGFVRRLNERLAELAASAGG
jgi:molecular chaperone HtpG